MPVMQRAGSFFSTFFLRLVVVAFLLVCMAPTLANAQFYQGYQMNFGKNRLQYNDLFWTFYRQSRFDVYSYQGGQELGDFVRKAAGEHLDDIERRLDYKLDGRVQFIVFNKLSDMRQSNIGLVTEEPFNIGGTTKIVGNKIFLYFTGDHAQLQEQISYGLAQIMINQILYGGDIKNALQNAALLTLPDWYITGLCAYLSKPWDATIDDRVRDGIINNTYTKFSRLTGEDARYAGQSVWAFIADKFGDASLSNLLYMTRVNRNIESAFLFVLGINSRGLSGAWYDYYNVRYAQDTVKRITPMSSMRMGKAAVKQNYQIKLSPSGDRLAWVSNDHGKYAVRVVDLSTNKRTTIKRKGYRSVEHLTDVSFPVLAWSPDGKTVSLVCEEVGKVWLEQFDLEKKESNKSQIFNIDKVLDMAYSDNGKLLVMSAVVKGQSDVFVYNTQSRTMDNITNDRYDDFNPRFVQGSRKIVFASCRLSDSIAVSRKDTLPGMTHTDLFLYDYKGKAPVLQRITATQNINESMPTELDSSHLVFISDANGVRNRYIAHLDSILSFVDTIEHYRDKIDVWPVTDYSQGIISQDINAKRTKMAQFHYIEGKVRMVIVDAPSTSRLESTSLQETPFRLKQKLAGMTSDAADRVQKPVVIDVRSPMPGLDLKNTSSTPYFQNEFQYLSTVADTINRNGQQAAVASKDSIYPPSIKKQPGVLKRNYNTAFGSSYLQLQLDNSLLSPTYQLYAGGGPVTFGSGMNLKASIAINDLFEDYRITGAIKTSNDFRTLGYYISVENLKHRLDKQLTFYREGRMYTFDGSNTKIRVQTNELRYQLKYPFSEVSSVRTTFGFRSDRAVYLSTDIQNLQVPNYYDNYLTFKTEYVFDNTISRGLNLYQGIRFKAFFEIMQEDDLTFENNIPKTIKLNKPMYAPGFDFRHYQKIHRDIIWANRIAAATSLGEGKIVYYLGSTDSWSKPQFNYSIPIDNSQNYAFQALATNLRGFQQNIRNGNSFAVINSELRIPVFKYLMSRPIKSDFIKNFQVIGFCDAGSAWTGKSPWAAANSLNSNVIESPPFTITLVNQRQPIVAGYGYGLRSRLLGYFARLDWAWGFENGKTNKPRMLYFSLGMDF